MRNNDDGGFGLFDVIVAAAAHPTATCQSICLAIHISLYVLLYFRNISNYFCCCNCVNVFVYFFIYSMSFSCAKFSFLSPYPSHRLNCAVAAAAAAAVAAQSGRWLSVSFVFILLHFKQPTDPPTKQMPKKEIRRKQNDWNETKCWRFSVLRWWFFAIVLHNFPLAHLCASFRVSLTHYHYL